ncbi:SDR family NAD(P)-dependent oxidoreductase [Novosphingobium resinovorum]|uniref:2-deoxy-D-gluconate 3-dehydrogenase n=1 Tax=Novosphingobium resinovorum TaxID=158500 RepID=A0A1D8AEF2_9SPHN|nr:glucose 1-dehydrogenase [Novosphingobium resinovorum]AOR80502.1 2-deoxy-D-gluconate 3-dehydrogenase [Novosphingobium resinovorum]
MFDLTGKRALVTGASSGLGAHFARVLARAGAHVVVAARREEALRTLVEEIMRAGGSAAAVRLDVTDAASVAEAVAAAGRLDVLVNNAGVTNTKPVLDQTEDDFDFILDTNLKGGFLVATQVARAMRDAGTGGSIVNVASILGLRQGGQVTPYAISKAGVIQMTRQLGLELARFGIRVNALAPGYVATELNDAFFASEAGQVLVRRIPQRRLGALEDLDGPLLLLASDTSRYMTGSTITVDGGHLVSTL